MGNLQNDKVIRKYTKQVTQLLNCPRDYREKFIADLQESLSKLISENESINESDIVGYFGTPAELAQTYLDDVPLEELSAYRRKKRLRIIITFLILILSFGITVSYLSYEAYISKKGMVIHIEENMETLDENIE